MSQTSPLPSTTGNSACPGRGISLSTLPSLASMTLKPAPLCANTKTRFRSDVPNQPLAIDDGKLGLSGERHFLEHLAIVGIDDAQACTLVCKYENTVQIGCPKPAPCHRRRETRPVRGEAFP